LVGPAVLVEERSRVAPRPVVGFRGIAPKPVENGFERRAASGVCERSFGVPLADLVREQAPELIELARNNRKRIGRGSFFFRGCGGDFFFRGNLVLGFRRLRWNSGGIPFPIPVVGPTLIGNRVLYVLYNLYVLREGGSRSAD
jgi:hypothetical protein